MADDELETMQGELKAYKEQLDTLRDEVALLFRFATIVRGQILAYAKGAGPTFDPVVVEKCKKLAEKYDITDGF